MVARGRRAAERFLGDEPELEMRGLGLPSRRKATSSFPSLKSICGDLGGGVARLDDGGFSIFGNSAARRMRMAPGHQFHVLSSEEARA